MQVEIQNLHIDSRVGSIPFSIATPEDLRYEVPVIFAPGWSEGMVSFRRPQEVMSRFGRQSVIFEHPRRGGKEIASPDYPKAEMLKALALLDVIDQTGQEKVDVVAHSEGAIYTIIAARLNPDRFRNIVLVAPAGLIGRDTFPRLMGRFSKKIFRNLRQASLDLKVRKDILRAHLSAVAYVGNNIVRALNEARAISKLEIAEDLDWLRDKGIGIGVIQYQNDAAFPATRMQERLAGERVDRLIGIDGLHDHFLYYPSNTAFISAMLSSLEKQNRENGRKRIIFWEEQTDEDDL